MRPNAEGEHENDGCREEWFAGERSQGKTNVSLNRVYPARAPRVARVFLMEADVAEFAPCDEARRFIAHSIRDKSLDSAVEMRLHLGLHLALECRRSKQGAQPESDAVEHGVGPPRWSGANVATFH
ncbi:MAG TPA: hypothetical protein VH539_05015 [Gemmatimonadaceae bacterium]